MASGYKRTFALKVRDRNYAVLRTPGDRPGIAPVKILVKDGKVLDQPIIEKKHAGDERAGRLRIDSPSSEINVVRELEKRAPGVYQHSVPMLGYVADFYCPATNVVVEIDGKQHRKDPHLWRDKIRDQVFRTRDIRVIRIPAFRVFQELDRVIDEMISAATRKTSMP